MDNNGVFSIKFEDFLRAIPATRAMPAYVGDPLLYLQVVFEAVAKEAAEDALKGPPGSAPQLFVRPQGGGGWLHMGPADRMPADDLKSMLLVFEADEDVEVEVRPMTQEEVDALPEFGGW